MFITHKDKPRLITALVIAAIGLGCVYYANTAPVTTPGDADIGLGLIDLFGIVLAVIGVAILVGALLIAAFRKQ